MRIILTKILCCLFMDVFFDLIEKCTLPFSLNLSRDELKCLLEDRESLIDCRIVDHKWWLDADRLS